MSRLPRFWHFFGTFSAVSKTTLCCAYPLTELHQTRFLGLLQAIPPESSVGNGKTSLLADCHGFGAYLALFWHFFSRLEDDALLRLPIDRIAPNSFTWAFAGHFTGIERWERGNIIISRLPWFWRFFRYFLCRLEDGAVLRLPIDRIAPNSISWAFGGHSTGIES